MKKLRAKLMFFFASHLGFTFFISITNFVISCGLALSFMEFVPAIAGTYSITSFYAMFRFITYKTGKIPFFMIDTIYSIIRRIHSEEEAEEKFKEISLKLATDFFLISVIMLFILAVCLVFKLIFNG